MPSLESRTIVWLPVHDYNTALADRLGVSLAYRLPVPGTVGWLRLDDDDPVKKAALLQAASQRILHLEIDQEARAEASKSVSSAADWPTIGRELQQLAAARAAGVRIEREVRA